MEVGNEDSGIGDLFVVMEVAGWVDFLGFRVELPTLTRDAMEWEGGGPEIDDRFAAAPELLAALQGLLNEPYGCTLCDAGRPRNPEKGHQPDCPYEAARAAIAKAKS